MRWKKRKPDWLLRAAVATYGQAVFGMELVRMEMRRLEESHGGVEGEQGSQGVAGGGQ